MKQILLCTDGSLYSQVAYEYAAWLALRIDLKIEILYVTDQRREQAVQTKDFSGSIGIDSYQQLLEQLVTLERARAKINHERAKIILAEAKKLFDNYEITDVTLIHETGFLVDIFHKFENNADLIILGKRGETASFATEHLGANMERIVRSSHKPCLVTPRKFQAVNKVLLAYDGGKSCQKALNYLSNSSIFYGLEVHVITVANRGAKWGLEQLEFAQRKLTEANFKPITNLLTGEPETAIQKYIDKHKINFLVMGAYGHSRIRHLVIGSNTAQMLRSSHIPVMLFR